MRPFLFDMETSDPDDFLTLLLLLGHPEVNLVAVTVTPGTREQLGLVRWALAEVGRADVALGAFAPDHDKRCVSQWHYDAYGLSPMSAEPDAPGHEILAQSFTGEATLVTGAALKNLGRLLASEQRPEQLGALFVQGGFAGEGVVPDSDQLPKFRGKVTVPSFNLGGDPKSALRTLEARGRFRDLRFVSKNVCHGVVYDEPLHVLAQAALAEMEPDSVTRRCWSLVVRGMTHYLRKNKGGKALHDPLAACCAIDPEIGRWAEVEIYRERGEWGSRLAPGSGVRIITGYDRDRFIETLLSSGAQRSPGAT